MMDEATAKKLAGKLAALIQVARIQGKTWFQCEDEIVPNLLSASRPAPGYLRASEGADMRLLGTLPVTADGCVLGEMAECFCDCGGGFVAKCDSGKAIANIVQADGEEAIVPREELYSTRTAAESAKGGQ